MPYIPYEKLREMDKKDIPELLLSVTDEADYVDAYKEVTDIESWNVEVTPMSNNYETMGFAFTHQGLKEYEKSIDNHIFHFCRTYAYAGEQHNRREGDFYPIMEFLHSAGEQLLVDDLKRFDVKVMELATAEEVENLYRTVPNEPHQAAYIKVMDRKTDTVYSRIYVFCAGQEEKCLNGDTYEVTRVRGDEKKELGSYLLKPGPEAAMDFFHNILKRDDKLEVSIKSTETGFSLTDNSEPDVNYIMTQVPMDDSFWETCTASKNR